MKNVTIVMGDENPKEVERWIVGKVVLTEREFDEIYKEVLE